jgi:hypothetical protein
MTETETERAASGQERIAAGERVLSLSEAADVLRMKRSNTAKFLARRGIEPAFPKAQGYFWWEVDVERARDEREADKARMAADARRRDSAIHGRPPQEPPPPPELARLGAAQREILSELVRHPIPNPKDARRFALRRLAQRGLAERLPDDDGVYVLTKRGRGLAGHL